MTAIPCDGVECSCVDKECIDVECKERVRQYLDALTYRYFRFRIKR